MRLRREIGWRRRVMVLLVALVVAVTALPAAGQQAGDSPPLRIAIPGSENNLTPYGITFRSGKTIDLIPLVFDTLFYSPFELEPEPWLASDFEVSGDFSTWTIELRRNVTWHDGQPLTAEDVEFSYEYIAENISPLYSHHLNDQPDIEEIEVIDDHTIDITCSKPCPAFRIHPGALVPILPEHIWSKVAEPATFTEQLPVGSGPYRLVRYVPDQLYVLEANEDYFKGAPLVDELQLPIIPESSAMFLALRTGEVDAVSRIIPPEAVPQLERAGLEIVTMPDYGSVAIDFNNQRPVLTERDFRKALNLAVDTQEITRTLLADRGKPGVESYLDPDSGFADTSLRREHDPAQAEALLEGLGFEDRDGDGLREDADGRKLRLEVLVSSVDAREVRASELAAEQIRDVGIELRVTPLDPATLNETTSAAGPAKTGNYDMQVNYFAGGHFHADPDGLLYLFHCPGETGIGVNFTGYCNEEFDRVVEEAAVLGVEERRPLLVEAQRILFDDPPALSLYFPDGTFAYDPDAYSGWIGETGHGIFHKRSFLPGERAEAAAATRKAAERGEGGMSPAVVVVVAVGALVVIAALARRRARTGLSGGPEID